MEFGRKRWTSYRVQSVDPFRIKKLHQFKRNWILAQKKTSTEMKIFKKCNFWDRNDRIWLKNDDSPGEFFPLNYFQSKSALICLKLNSGAKNKTTAETKILKKMPCRRPKRWNLAEKRWTSYRVQSVDPFPIEKLHQFKRNWILALVYN